MREVTAGVQELGVYTRALRCVWREVGGGIRNVHAFAKCAAHLE